MKYIDMHCDTLMWLANPNTTGDLFQNSLSVDFKRMQLGEGTQFFAIFMLPEGSRFLEQMNNISDDDYINKLHGILFDNLEKYKDVAAFTSNYEMLQANRAANKVSAFLTIEDGRAVRGDMARLEKFYDMGVRLISLTWNHHNCFGAPNSYEPEVMNTGLTDFGKEAVARMNELGMLIDVSHLSDGGFWDVVKLTKKPFVASHSNCRAISPHKRNMTDDMIRALAEKGGVMGINFGPEFLNPDVERKESTAALMSAHIQHIKKIGGIDTVALGSDFDGIGGELQVSGSDKLGVLFDRLHWDGFTDAEIEKIAHLNAERVIRESMK